MNIRPLPLWQLLIATLALVALGIAYWATNSLPAALILLVAAPLIGLQWVLVVRARRGRPRS